MDDGRRHVFSGASGFCERCDAPEVCVADGTVSRFCKGRPALGLNRAGLGTPPPPGVSSGDIVRAALEKIRANRPNYTLAELRRSVAIGVDPAKRDAVVATWVGDGKVQAICASEFFKHPGMANYPCSHCGMNDGHKFGCPRYGSMSADGTHKPRRWLSAECVAKIERELSVSFPPDATADDIVASLVRELDGVRATLLAATDMLKREVGANREASERVMEYGRMLLKSKAEAESLSRQLRSRAINQEPAPATKPPFRWSPLV